MKHTTSRLAPWSLAAALAVPLPAAAVQALGCLIEPDRVADVGSPVVAVIDSVEVERGQPVKQGQVLVVLRAGVERAAFDAARSRADASADVQAAASNAKFNHDRLLRAEDLFRQNFISQQALDQARTESQMADQRLTQAREQQAISRQDRGVAAAQLQQRTIRSPMDGVVAERYMSAGERADDKPLLRIARVDPLRVQLVLPTTLYGQVKPDNEVSVVPELPGAVPLTAKVSMVDRVIDPASNTFRVQLTLPNPDLSLPAGLRCTADFGPAAASPRDLADAATPPPAAPELRFPPSVVRASVPAQRERSVETPPPAKVTAATPAAPAGAATVAQSSVGTRAVDR